MDKISCRWYWSRWEKWFLPERNTLRIFLFFFFFFFCSFFSPLFILLSVILFLQKYLHNKYLHNRIACSNILIAKLMRRYLIRLLQFLLRFSLSSALRIQIKTTTHIASNEVLPLSAFVSRSFFFYRLFLSVSCPHTHTYLYLLLRIYVAMRDGTGRRAPVGAIVAAQITMPDRRRGQTF